MKFQRNTLILVSVAAILSVAVLVLEAQRSRLNDPSGLGGEVANRDRLFEFEEADITRIVLDKDGETLIFERDDTLAWQMLEPEAVLAEQAAIAFLLNLVTTHAPSRIFTIDPDKRENFGLEMPTATLTLTLASGETHTLLLGATDFSGGSLYAIIDSTLDTDNRDASTPADASAPSAAPPSDLAVAVVTIDFMNAVTRPLSDWQATIDPPPESFPEESFPEESSPEEEADLEEADGAAPAPAPEPAANADEPTLESDEGEGTDTRDREANPPEN